MSEMNQAGAFQFLRSCIRIMNSDWKRSVIRMKFLESLVLSDLLDLSKHSSSKCPRCELNVPRSLQQSWEESGFW